MECKLFFLKECYMRFKKIIFMLFLISVMLFPSSAFALQSGDFTYEVSVGGTVTITGYAGAGGNVVIPITIGGLTVASIANFAFEVATSITSITILANVTSIGDYAFYNCSGLTRIDVDSSNPNYSSQDGVLYNKNKTYL